MQKIKEKAFDLIIIVGLIFLIMQISIITTDHKNDGKSPVEKTVQTPPPTENNSVQANPSWEESNNKNIVPDQTKKQISNEQERKTNISIDL